MYERFLRKNVLIRKKKSVQVMLLFVCHSAWDELEDKIIDANNPDEVVEGGHSLRRHKESTEQQQKLVLLAIGEVHFFRIWRSKHQVWILLFSRVGWFFVYVLANINYCKNLGLIGSKTRL